METTKKNYRLVQAQYLRKGDKLAHTNGVVTHTPHVGIKTPSGKVELGVNGYLKTWGKRTEIAVLNDGQ